MDPAIELVLTISLGIIMFSLGLSLTVGDFRRVMEDKKTFFIGAFTQILMLPMLASLIIILLRPPTEVAIGLLILSVAPGGATSAFMTRLLRGNVALSVSLTAVFSVVCVVTTPVLLAFFVALVTEGEASVTIPIADIMRSMLAVVVGPVAVGMVVHALLPALTRRVLKPVQIVAGVLFFALLIGAIASQADRVMPYLAVAGLFTIVLNIATILGALGVTYLARLRSEDGVAIMFECGVQNAPLAMFIAISLLQQPELSIPAATYGILQAPITLLLAFALYRAGYNRQAKPASA